MGNDNVEIQGLEFEIISNGDEAAEKIGADTVRYLYVCCPCCYR